jgi:hypothetical protein
MSRRRKKQSKFSFQEHIADFLNASAILKAFARYRKGTPFVPEDPEPELCTRLHFEILAAGVFTQTDAHDFVKLVASGTDAQVQFKVNGLRVSSRRSSDRPRTARPSSTCLHGLQRVSTS